MMSIGFHASLALLALLASLALLALLGVLSFLACGVCVERCRRVVQDVQLVIARYAEPLDWVRDFEFNDDVLVYDKSHTTLTGPRGHGYRSIRLPNVGREAHTFLWHILRHWDSLADITIFVPGGAGTMPHKRAKLDAIVRDVCAGRSSFPLGQAGQAGARDVIPDFTPPTVAPAATNASRRPRRAPWVPGRTPSGCPELPSGPGSRCTACSRCPGTTSGPCLANGTWSCCDRPARARTPR
jgi:Protein of unknown function (DUF3431)